MIATEQKNALVLEDGEEIKDSVKMGIDWESEEFLMQTLSKHFYSDAIGSTCRELASNALDSHRRVKSTSPIIVSFKPATGGNYEFSVEDFGVGLDYEDVKNIISKYGRSTSRGEAGLLGMMGYGFKAPISYVSSFTFVIRKNGVEGKCMMYEGEEGMKIDLIDQRPTKEPNGVKVTVPVDYYDRQNFFNKIKEQLCYFENVYFDISYGGYTIDNNFKITRYDDFQLSELSQDNQMHLCLDNVYYPLDFKKLGIDAIDVPIGLRFGLSDGIFPVPNREQLRYTKEATEIILAKIKKVASEIITMYNKTVTDKGDIREVISYYRKGSKHLDIGHKTNINIDPLEKWSDVKVVIPKVKGIKLLDLKQLFSGRWTIDEFPIKNYIQWGRMRGKRHNEYLDINHLSDKVYFYTDKIGRNKLDYIKEIEHTSGRSDTVWLVRKETRKLFKDSSTYRESYVTLLKLGSHPRKEWRARIKEWQSIIEMLSKSFTDADALVIPKAWLDARKAQRVSRSAFFCSVAIIFSSVSVLVYLSRLTSHKSL